VEYGSAMKRKRNTIETSRTKWINWNIKLNSGTQGI
jgi:hypothetical protein